MKNKLALGVALAVAFLCVLPAHASLTTFATFNGTVDMRSAGWGSNTQSGTISITPLALGVNNVLAVYLYTSTFQTGLTGVGATLEGTHTAFTSLGANNGLTAGRADVTSFMKAKIEGGQTAFSIKEDASSQDGEALVVVYSNATLSNSTVGILDGFSAQTGDDATITFSSPLHPAAPGFFAEMRIGDGFSCCGQASSITVNGTKITDNAGNDDDCVDAGPPANGCLITVGDDNDPFSPLNPTYAADHERYNLVPQIADGDTQIKIHTINPSHDDNIFLEMFHVTGNATINTVPEPASIMLFGTVLAGLALRFRRKRA